MKNSIIFVLPQLKTGGGVRVIIELANVLVKEYSVKIVIPNSKEKCSFVLNPKIKIIKIGKNNQTKLTKIKNMLLIPFVLYKNYRNNFIIITDPIQSLFFMPFRFKKLFRYVQADDYRIFDDMMLLKNKFFLIIYKFLTKLSYKKQCNYLFNSTFSFNKFVNIRGSKVPKHIVHPSINHDYFYPKNKANHDKKNIILITRKHPIKRFIDFIEAYKKLSPSIKQKIDEIFIITQDDLSSFDLQNFKIIKPKDDRELVDILHRGDIFVFCSLWEAFGLPPLEAMACGLGVITSHTKGCDEYAKNGYNALIYPPKDTNNLKKAIEKLIEDEKLLVNLQQNAIITSKDFTWEKSANDFKNIVFGKKK